MNKSEFKVKFKRFYDTFGDFLNAYEKNNPEWMSIAFSQILYNSIISLKALIESPKEKETTWDIPFVELQYPIEADWEKLTPVFMTITDKDLEDAERTSRLFAKGFLRIRDMFIFRALTKEVLTIIKGDKYFHRLTVELDKKLNNLSEKERKNKVDKLIKSITKSIEINFIAESFREGKGEEKRIKGSVFIQFNPCVINADEKKAYYPIVMGIGVKGHKPASWDKKTRELLWKGLLQGVKNAFPKEVLDFELEPLPEPTVKPISKEAPLVKVGLHAELQKFGHRTRPKQLGLFDSLLDDTKKEITEKSIEVVGLDITQAQNQALFAIQKLLTETNYRGNIPGQKLESTAFKFRGYLPALEFSPAQYLKAYGVAKYKTSRGWEEFSGEERRQALQALVDLTRPFLLVYKQEYKKKKERRIDRIEVVTPLIKIMRGWEALTKKEDVLLDKGTSTRATDEKLKAIAIEPAPILVQDIDSYFVLKPANYLQEIKFLYPHASKFVYRFIDWLITQAGLKSRKRQPLIIKENYEEIAHHLRMDAYIRNRHYKRIKQILNKCYRIAKEQGYLLSYGTIQGQTKNLERLELNQDKFRKVRETEEKRERIRDKETVH